MASNAKTKAPLPVKRAIKTQTYTDMHVARSDGVAWTPQEIIDDMIVTATKEKIGISEPLGEDEERARAWMIKLGKFVKFNVGTDKNDKTEYIVNFPANYHLRTQILKGRDDGVPFLYGHPLGPKERFRSPAEFALHLLWLLSNSQTQADCSCLLCKKMIKGFRKPVVAPVETLATAPVAATIQPKKPTAQAATTGPAPAATASRTKAGSTKYAHSGGGSAVFRIGELIWFKRGTAWRLGIVRYIGTPEAGAQGPDDRKTKHQIAQLGHALLNQQDIVKEAGEMRPFLGFSIPKPNPPLENMTYDQVQWHQLAASFPNPEVIGLEASKLAAVAINGAFSFFNRMQSISPTQHTYGGVFLGAEHIRVGDAIRVRPMTGADPMRQDTMCVRSIYSDGNSVAFLGNTYRATEGPALPRTEQPEMAIFADELRMYVEVTQQPWHWQVQERDAVRKEMEVYGRFYAADKLMVLLDPEDYKTKRDNGGVPIDGTAYLNRRFQTGNAGYVGRKPTRNATIGAAIASPLMNLEPAIVEEAAAV